MNGKIEQIIYKFDEDGNAINSSSIIYEIECIAKLKYKVILEINWARTSFGWVGGGSLISMPGYSKLQTIKIDCNSNTDSVDSSKKAILNTIIELARLASKQKYPEGINNKFTEIYSTYSHYNLFGNE